MIEARSVSVKRGARTVLNDVNFHAEPGAVAVIVGPNGSGKSTLLGAVSGDLAYAGSISMNGKEISTSKPVEQAAMRAVLPQATTLSFPFTVREIVGLGIVGGHAGVSGHLLRTLPDQALARVDLEGFAGRQYQELSGGEQQRVQLARVLCQVWTPVLSGKPRWLLLDEPVSSLDIKHQLAIMGVAREFARAGGGVVAILHDLNLAAMFADAIHVLSSGRILATGAPLDVLRDTVIEQAFDCRLKVGALPANGAPFVLPQSAASNQS